MDQDKKQQKAEEPSQDKSKADEAPAESPSSSDTPQSDDVKGYGEPPDGSGGN